MPRKRLDRDKVLFTLGDSLRDAEPLPGRRVTADDARTLPDSGPARVPIDGWTGTTAVPDSGTTSIDALASGRKWGGAAGTGVTLEYSFATAASFWKTGYGSGEPGSLAILNDAQKAAVRAALATWSDVANITFVEVQETATNVGTMRFALSPAW